MSQLKKSFKSSYYVKENNRTNSKVVIESVKSYQTTRKLNQDGMEADDELAKSQKIIGSAVKKYIPNNFKDTDQNKDGTDIDSLCALLFFGLGRSFKEKAFPSIIKYLLHVNPSCKVFVHTYDVANEKGTHINERELSLLTNDASSIIFETEEEFRSQHNLTLFHKYFPTNVNSNNWKFPTSIDNMIRQWHSIEKAWKLMLNFENKRQLKFLRVGFFRPDVIYTHPISIVDQSEPAVIPSMMYFSQQNGWNGLNDRMFYGTRKYGEVWATQRFCNIDNYIQWQQSEISHIRHDLRGLHSEDFMKYVLTTKGRLPLEIKNICFKRVRSNGDVLHCDCRYLETNNGNEYGKTEVDLRLNTAPRVIVLGMQRSGTSLLAGLLSHTFSWNVPGQVYHSSKCNNVRCRSSYQNFHVVQQNEEWLNSQNVSWDNIKSDNDQLVARTFDANLATKIGIHGQKALDLYNNGAYTPWLMNDPRLCFTLGAWIPLLESEFYPPPVIFMYRNPLEIGLIRQAEAQHTISLLESFYLWILYNREAIRLTQDIDICRIATRKPEQELFRLQDELMRCGLHPRSFKLDEITKELLDRSSSEQWNVSHNSREEVNGDETCDFIPFQNTGAASSNASIAAMESKMYDISMKIYCDLKSSKAFERSYLWPDMPQVISDETQYRYSKMIRRENLVSAERSMQKGPAYSSHWKDLSKYEREAAKALGFTKKMWDKGAWPGGLDSKYWNMLETGEQAALERLGYLQSTWDIAITNDGMNKRIFQKDS
ncbi:hypothetical protein CTEN210_10376 [Chaetoceros tenuissimus]|uniref:Uncharacterized protein n=1 Tax=Chaetoceros tenuissimus TaxID=426638 RepID=A0AAD3H840_9STRA|nr:hypothetical protein CTEN210_10376 [Chaetoceros tenuissimus]